MKFGVHFQLQTPKPLSTPPLIFEKEECSLREMASYFEYTLDVTMRAQHA